MEITADIKFIGVNDHEIDLFESQYAVPNGMSYNSYLIIDEKIAVMDTVDARFTDQWLNNIQKALVNRLPDYLIIQHMEPDHSANIVQFANKYPNAKIISSSTSFIMMKNFFGVDFKEKMIVVKDDDTLTLGKHKLRFITAPMVHWPEVIVVYDCTDKVLFSADAFGKFGALDVQEDWLAEARRYYIGIVGKYGVQVQSLLKKINCLDIQIICSLHGPVIKENIGYYIGLYHTWSSYQPEDKGVVIAYTSIYGNTKQAVYLLADKLIANGCNKVVVHDLARCDMAQVVADAFRYNKLVLATTTYNADIFPFMREFISHLLERNFGNRIVAFIENGSWFPVATKVMKSMLDKCNNLTFSDKTVKIFSSLNEESAIQLNLLAEELCIDNPACQD